MTSLIDRVSWACAAWGISPLGSPELAGDIGAIEHTVHELAHAALLDISPCESLSDAVSDRIQKMSWSEQVDNEARAWAVEVCALRLLGLFSEDSPSGEDCVGWDTIYGGASIQGVQRNHIDVLLDEYSDDQCDMADQVIEWIAEIDPEDEIEEP